MTCESWSRGGIFKSYVRITRDNLWFSTMEGQSAIFGIPLWKVAGKPCVQMFRSGGTAVHTILGICCCYVVHTIMLSRPQMTMRGRTPDTDIGPWNDVRSSSCIVSLKRAMQALEDQLIARP